MTVIALRPDTLWWKTAPNPPCVPWCEEDHKADEFADGASLLCVKTIRKTPGLEVGVQALTYGTDHVEGYVPAPASVYLDVRSSTEDLSPIRARELVHEIALAVGEAAIIAEQTVR